jgi:hypothetical protein
MRKGAVMATNSGIRRTFFNASGQPVAILSGRTLRKRVRGSIHQLRQPPAWAVDAEILEAAKRDGATQVEVVDVESHKTHRAPLDAFFVHGFRFNRGHGDQIGLALCHWRVETPGVEQLDFEF